jgi:hypothetical protein
MPKDSMQLSLCKRCVSICFAFTDYKWAKLTVTSISFEYPIVSNLFEVAEGNTIAIEVLWVLRIPMNAFGIENIERDKVCHKSRGKSYICKLNFALSIWGLDVDCDSPKSFNWIESFSSKYLVVQLGYSSLTEPTSHDIVADVSIRGIVQSPSIK